jgi:hypothetical protein
MELALTKVGDFINFIGHNGDVVGVRHVENRD